MPKLDRDNLAELGEAYRAKLDQELQPTSPGKEMDWAIFLSIFGLRRNRLVVKPIPELDQNDLAKIGEAYRTKLDEELRPSQPHKEIDWGILLSTSEIRRTLALRAMRLSPFNRAAFSVMVIGLVLAVLWLISVGVDAFLR